MGLFKRITICTSNFVTTGQTGIFITTNQTGDFVSDTETGIFVTTGQTGQFGGGSGFGGISATGFLALGLNPYFQNSGETIISNSYFPSGETQFSYFVCCQTTEGCNFAGNLNCDIGCFDIKLFNDKCHQIWMIKNSLIGIGQHWNNNSTQQYSVDSVAIVNANLNGNYVINGPFTTTYTKTQNDFCINLEAGISGVIFKVYDSDDTKMKWTNKIEIVQSIAQDPLYNAGIDPQDMPSNEILDGGEDV